MSVLASLNVLVVEDEWLVRMELVTGFEDEHCTVFESASAEDALDILEAHRRDDTTIHLLVTDIRLTGALTGWNLAARARALDPDIAVLYVSANPPVADRTVAGSLFIDKPALITDVIAAAQRLIG